MAAEALIFAPFLALVFTLNDGTSILLQAAVITAVGFTILSAIGLFTRKDLSGLRAYVMWGSVVAFGLIIVAVVFGLPLGAWFSVAMIGLAGAAILYQTQDVAKRYPIGSHVAAATVVFESLMTLYFNQHMSKQRHLTGGDIALANTAIGFSAAAYQTGTHPLRKFTHEPYIMHPLAVAKIVMKYREANGVLIAIAIAHDVLEDTSFTYDDLANILGIEVADGVFTLTDVPASHGGPNRADRKALDRERIAAAAIEIQDVRLADAMHNLPDLCENDPNFAWQKYLPEKTQMFEAIVQSRGGSQESMLIKDFRALLQKLVNETMPI